MNAVDLYFFLDEIWFVFDLFFVFVIDVVPQKKEKRKKKTLLDGDWAKKKIKRHC